jgi:hypothetical protein
MRRFALSCLVIAALAGAARADVLHLRNGRILEGRVIKRTDTAVHVRMPAGVLVVPLSTIAAVDSRSTAEDELADAIGAIDLDDPRTVEELALWCSQRGLGEQASDLLALSRGVRLERVVAAARAEGTPWAFVDAYHWARTQGFDDLTLGWLVGQAEARGADDPAVVEARATLQRDAAALAEAEARAAERRSRPSYVDPARTHLPGDGDGFAGVRVSPHSSTGRQAGDPDPGARGRALIDRLTRLRDGPERSRVGVKSAPPTRSSLGAKR